MMSNVQHQIWTGKQAGLVGIAILLLAGFCFGQPAVSLSPKDGPPTTNLRVSGSGFTPYAAIDIYFDSKDEALAIANGAGAFSQVAIQAPASALPGMHWVSVVERSGHLAKQEQFEVNVNWTEFHTKDMRRWNPYENVLNVDNVGSLQLKGSYTTGGGTSSPAVVNGVVYVGSEDSNVYALNARTGTKLWSYPTSNDVVSSPAVANGVVYVASDDGNVYALDAHTGALLWSYTTGLTENSSPTVVDGVVYIGSNSPGGGTLFALNSRTGALLWSYNTQSVSSSPAVAYGVVYFGINFPGVANGDPYSDGVDGTFIALDARTGAPLWSYGQGLVYSSPAVAKGVVYSDGPDGFDALNASTGALLWSYAIDGSSSSAVANGVVFVGSDNGNVYALNASTGALLWSYPTGGAVSSSPAVANGVVYVGSDDGNMYALNARTGAKLWSYTSGAASSSPAVANGVVYVGSGDGKVYAFSLPRGLEEQEAGSKRPELKALHPDFNLKAFQSMARPSDVTTMN